MQKFTLYRSATIIRNFDAADLREAAEIAGMDAPKFVNDYAYQWFTSGDSSYALEVVPFDSK